MLVGYATGEAKELDPKPKPGQIMLGFYHTLGGGFRIYYEGTFYDTDVGDPEDLDFDSFDEDLSQHLFGFRYDY